MTINDLKDTFVQRNLTLGSAESFTGGLFAQQITSVPGASQFFKGSLVTYATEEKMRILGVSKEIIDRYGVVSQEVAGEMAGHALALLNVDYAVSFTGNAGPSALEGKPVGEIYIGISSRTITKVYRYQLSGDRHHIQEEAVQLAISLLEKEF